MKLKSSPYMTREKGCSERDEVLPRPTGSVSSISSNQEAVNAVVIDVFPESLRTEGSGLSRVSST